MRTSNEEVGKLEERKLPFGAHIDAQARQDALRETLERLERAMTYAYDVLRRPEVDSDDEDFLRLAVGYD